MSLSLRPAFVAALRRITALPGGHRVFGLDFMRAIAILGVLQTHAQLVLPDGIRARITGAASVSGALGVELFFVLSGFLIGSILLSLAPRFESPGVLPYFWQRRWFRTVPNYLLFVVLNMAAFRLLTFEIPNLAAYLTFTQNWLWPHPEFFRQAWSLTIEEWFYLLFPISLFLLHRLFRSFDVAFLLSAALFIAVPTLVRIGWALDGLSDWDENYRKVMFVRLDAIMYGVLAAWVRKTYLSAWRTTRFFALGIGALVVVSSWLLASRQGLESFFAKTFLFSLLSLGLACVLPACDQWQITRESFVTRAFRLIALWSYSLYLCNLLIVQSLMYIQVRIGSTSPLLGFAFVLVFYGASLLVASGIYAYFEKPVMDLRERFGAERKVASQPATD